MNFNSKLVSVMGRRGIKSKTNGDVEPVAIAIAATESTENTQEGFEQNGDDPLAEIENEKELDEEDKALKKKFPRKRTSEGGAKKKGKRVKKESNEAAENMDDDNAKPAEESYEVDKILDVQYLKSGAREFLIRWKDCGPESDTWEPEDNLCCPDLIAKFTDQNTSSKGKGKKKQDKKKTSAKATDKAPKVINPDEEYEVEKIIEVHHKKDGTKEFLIRWKGCTANEDTWEPEANLSCPELIARFMQKVDNASKFEKREVRTLPKHTERFTLAMKSAGRRVSKRYGNKQRATYYDAE